MTWVDPQASSERLETVRYWALKAAEQSREYGEAEEVWAAFLDMADRASDVLDQRTGNCPRPRSASCAVLRMRATAEDREKRNGCVYPQCLAANKQIQPGRVRFHFNI